MLKLVYIANAGSLNIHAIDFACFIAALSKSKLKGVFIENKDEEKNSYFSFGSKHSSDTIVIEKEAVKKDRIMIAENVHLFKEACTSRNTNYSINRFVGDPVKKAIEESRFADVIIIDSTLSFEEKPENIPTHFVKQLLAHSECAVMLAPPRFNRLDEITFTYDGSSSSVRAIKQFSYLFPDLRNKKAVVTEVVPTDFLEISKREQLNEWLDAHYTNYEMDILQGIPENELMVYLLGKKNNMVIMGAYGRSSLSRFFKHSSLDVLAKVLTQPVFIMHD